MTTHEGLLHRFLDLLTRNLCALVISHGFHIPFAVRFDMLLQKPRHVTCKSTMNGCHHVQHACPRARSVNVGQVVIQTISGVVAYTVVFMFMVRVLMGALARRRGHKVKELYNRWVWIKNARHLLHVVCTAYQRTKHQRGPNLQGEICLSNFTPTLKARHTIHSLSPDAPP